jgi:crotonobetainyl-CoA:carnitine CoA-transferase CaiB-like acyl-CoA transferase
MIMDGKMKDLEGLLVVALEQAVAGPYASCKLADAGARVIKVERAEGDFARNYDKLVHGESSYFVWLNRGKESVCLDLKRAEDIAVLSNIVAKADIFIQNLAPGSVARLGFGAEELTQKYPSLIYCSISGYGEDGPYRDQKAYDMLIQGESGLISVNGTPEGVARVGISICDVTAGMTAYSAIVQALVARARTAKGRIIEVSLFHAISDWMNVPYLQTRYGKAPPQRVGVRHPTIAPYGAFRCADGKDVLLSIQNEREWVKLCTDILDDAALAANPLFSNNINRVKNCAALETIIAEKLKRFTREEAVVHLNKSGIACGRLSSMDDLVSHPQVRLTTAQSASGPVEMLAPGAKVKGTDLSLGPVPKIGEHTQSITKEFTI